MKTKLLFIGALMYVLVSCDKKEEPAVTDSNIDLEHPTYADKTVAETKTDLENTGIKMVTELKAMNQDKGVKATVNLVTLASNSGSVSKKLKTSTYFKVLGAVKNLSENKTDVKVMFDALEDTGKISILDEFDGIAGVYTYNFYNGDFDFVANVSSEKVVFEFPASIASKNSEIIDGKLTIYKPKVKTGNFTALGESITELPTELKYDMSVNSTVVTTFLFTASYQDDGVPTSVESTITLGEFAFKVTYGYKETEVTANWSFTHGATTIFDIGGTAGGKFTKADIDKVEETVTKYDTVYAYYDVNNDGVIDNNDYYVYPYESSEIYPERILANANAHVQLMDIKIVGQIDFTNFMKDIRAAESGDYSIDSASVMINRNINLVVVYASDNTAIAKAEAYIKNEQYEAYECNYDQNTYEWVCETVTKTDKVIDVQMIFADGSKSTMQAYFEEGFNNVIDSFNEFITELNTTYNWEMQPIEKNNK
jgi:hypothetical protein